MQGHRTSGAALAAALAIALSAIAFLLPARTHAAPDAGHAAHAPGDTGASVDGGEPPADGGDVASASDGEVVDVEANALREELRSIRAFAEGRLGTIRSRELFRVDLRDDVAVAKRLEQLRRDVAFARTVLQEAEAQERHGASPEMAGASHGDAGAERVDGGADGATSEDALLFDGPPTERVRALLQLRVVEAAATVLAKPKAEREQLLAAEATAIKAELADRERSRADDEAREAEEARRKALADAQSARSKAERDLAQLRADIEAVRAEQIRWRASLVERQRTAHASEEELSRVRADIVKRAAEAASSVPETDALFDTVVGHLVDLDGRVRGLLDELDQGVRAPRPTDAIPTVSDPELAPQRERLKSERDALDASARAMEDDLRELIWSQLRSSLKSDRELNELRIELLGRVSLDKRRSVLGVGLEGRQQLVRELGRLHLELRWLRVSGWEVLREDWNALRGTAAIGKLSVDVLGALFVLWATLFVRKRLEPWVLAANAALARAIRRSAVIRASQRVAAVVIALGREVVTLLGVLALPRVVAIDWTRGAWSVPYTLVLWYAIYRLALNSTYRTLAWMAARRTAGTKLAPKILRSVRLSLRFAFAIAVVLAGAGAVLGRGYLYTLVVRIGWLGGLMIAWVLVRWWREDITKSFLRMRPTGALSRVVEQTRDRWVGFFVAIAAFIVLLLTALARSTRRFVLNFDQSRKALAYIFRRRLERQVELQRMSDTSLLGPQTLAFFTEQPPEDDSLALDRFPGMEEWMAGLRRWDDGAAVGATLVVGRTGYGKSSWLKEAQRRAGSRPFTGLSLLERASTERAVVVTLAKALGHEGIEDLATLSDTLARGPRRIIAIDDAHLWFVRGVGTLEAWHAFASIIERTSDNIMWLASFAHYPWEFVSWITKGDIVFRTVVAIPPWSETEIAELIEKRTKASGIEVTYDDLIAEDVDTIDGIDARARVLSTARDYNRLIWDYSEGSPRVAMHVWSRSLVPDGPGRARVRLFGSPETAWLDELSESAKFVLASILWHEQLSASEASAALRIPRGICEDTYDHLLAKGVAAPFRAGRVRITALWWPQVVRFLRRKHLIDS